MIQTPNHGASAYRPRDHRGIPKPAEAISRIAYHWLIVRSSTTAPLRRSRKPASPMRGERGRERHTMQTIKVKRRYRTIFLSDVHLGTRGCRADFLLDF